MVVLLSLTCSEDAAFCSSTMYGCMGNWWSEILKAHDCFKYQTHPIQIMSNVGVNFEETLWYSTENKSGEEQCDIAQLWFVGNGNLRFFVFETPLK